MKWWRLWRKWLTLSPALVKIRFDADKTTRDKDIAQDIAKARAVRETGGAMASRCRSMRTMAIRCRGAIRVGRGGWKSWNIRGFEEPCQSYHVQNLGKVAQALDIAVAAGEQEYTLQGVQRLIEAGVDIVQPDIVKTGGFTGMQQMAALAHAYGVEFCCRIRRSRRSGRWRICTFRQRCCMGTIPWSMRMRRDSRMWCCGSRWGR